MRRDRDYFDELGRVINDNIKPLPPSGSGGGITINIEDNHGTINIGPSKGQMEEGLQETEEESALNRASKLQLTDALHELRQLTTTLRELVRCLPEPDILNTPYIGSLQLSQTTCPPPQKWPHLSVAPYRQSDSPATITVSGSLPVSRNAWSSLSNWHSRSLSAPSSINSCCRLDNPSAGTGPRAAISYPLAWSSPSDARSACAYLCTDDFDDSYPRPSSHSASSIAPPYPRSLNARLSSSRCSILNFPTKVWRGISRFLIRVSSHHIPRILLPQVPISSGKSPKIPHPLFPNPLVAAHDTRLAL